MSMLKLTYSLLRSAVRLLICSRKRANDWYGNTLYSRLNDKEQGCIIVIMQRLHEDDLVGHILEQEGWEILNLPAIAETGTIYHWHSALFGAQSYNRPLGEPLHAARESQDTLATIRHQLGEYVSQGNTSSNLRR